MSSLQEKHVYWESSCCLVRPGRNLLLAGSMPRWALCPWTPERGRAWSDTHPKSVVPSAWHLLGTEALLPIPFVLFPWGSSPLLSFLLLSSWAFPVPRSLVQALQQQTSMEASTQQLLPGRGGVSAPGLPCPAALMVA